VFRITDGKGFHIKFANGFLMSVQWGPGNYCDNYGMDCMAMKEAGETGSTNAEIAVFDNHEEWYLIDGQEVTGHLSPDDVLALMVKVAALDPIS
jgi:hypothetical protein